MSGIDRIRAAYSLGAYQAGSDVAVLVEALEAAEAKLQAVRELHAKMVQPSGWAVCSHCEEGMLQDPADWPCPTVEAIGEG